jgi:hypothetical protein
VQKTCICGAATSKIIITNTHQQVDDAIIVRKGNVLDSSIMSPSDNYQQADAKLTPVVGVQTRWQTQINKLRTSIATAAATTPTVAPATATTADTGSKAAIVATTTEMQGIKESIGNVNQGGGTRKNKPGWGNRDNG